MQIREKLANDISKLAVIKIRQTPLLQRNPTWHGMGGSSSWRGPESVSQLFSDTRGLLDKFLDRI